MKSLLNLESKYEKLESKYEKLRVNSGISETAPLL